MTTRGYKAGLAVTDNESEIIYLFANPTAAGHYMTFNDMQAGASFSGGYQVPALKKLLITEVTVVPRVTNAGAQIGFGTTSVSDGVSAPSGSVNLGHDQEGTSFGVPLTLKTKIKIPAGNCPYAHALSGGVNVYAVGILLDA